MAIRKLTDKEAFLLMLKLLLRIFSKFDERRLVEFVFKFCELDKKPVDPNRLMNEIKKLLKKRAKYMKQKRLLQVQVNCVGDDLVEDPAGYRVFLSVADANWSLPITANEKETVYVPMQVGRIASESICVKISSASKGKPKEPALHSLRIDFKDIHLITGHSLKLNYDKEKKKYDHLKNVKRRVSKISSKLKSLSKRYLLSPKMARKSLEGCPNFEFELNWSPFDLMEFEESDASIKEQLAKRHQLHTDQHLRLLKYAYMQSAKTNPKFDGVFGDELKAILDQSLFEGGLNYADHKICLNKVTADLQSDQTVEWKPVLSKKSELLLSEFSEDTDESKEYLSFIIKPHENLNVPQPHDLPFKVKKAAQEPISLRRNRELPFDFGLMKYHFIDDFDSTSHKITIWITKSFSTPRFYRFSTEKSLNLFSYDHPLRKLCISIYTSIRYRLFIALYIAF